MNLTGNRSGAVVGLGVVVLAALEPGSVAARDRRVAVDIPAMPMARALRELGRQAGVNVLYFAAGRRDLTSNPVQARAEPEEIARSIVAGAGLNVIRDPTGALIVRGAPVSSEPPRKAAASPAEGRPPPPSPPERRREPETFAVLEELVVTATRQEEPINSVPLSISAQTQRRLDEQGVRQIADMQGPIPAMSVAQSAPGVAFVAIRGIQNNGQGAAVTGFYLDDTPLTKRGAFGCGLCTGNGTPLPPLFDLERVEVLRGPQGTLFGSGSQGGTIRYITPSPSLREHTAYARLEASDTWRGKPSYEAGAAVGGPLLKGRLGFRASFFQRNTGGWLDYRNRVTNETWARDANEGVTRVFRGALAWAPADNARLTLAYFSSRDSWRSRADGYYLDTRAPIQEPEACFNAAGSQLAACSGADVAYRRAPLTLPQVSGLERQTSLDPFLFPATTNLQVASLTYDYQFDKMAFRSITSYVDDQTELENWDGGAVIRVRPTNAAYDGLPVRNLGAYAGLPGLPQDYVYGRFYVDNRRYALAHEMRLSSPAEERPISWVAGVFFSAQRNTQRYDNVYPSLDTLLGSLYGVTARQRFRNGAEPYLINGLPIGFDGKYQTLKDVELAAFGEVNYWVTDRLRATVGVRVSHLNFRYTELHFGPASGGNDPRTIDGGITAPTAVNEAPIAPKLALQYHFSNANMVYGVVAKGFRAGGVNSAIPEGVCGAGLARLGETVASLPPTYDSDTVWSYEAGAKLRVLGERVQLNGSLYRIDWSNIQTTVVIPNPCGIPFTTNVGAARSQGFELETQARLFRNLRLDIAIAHTDAAYTRTAISLGKPGFDSLPAALAGQKLAVPPWTVQVGARYDHRIAEDFTAFVRLDWRRLNGLSGTGAQTFGSGAYSPTSRFPSSERTNVRVGLIRGPLEASLFVNNLFNSRTGGTVGGYASCPTASNGGDPSCSGGLYNSYFTVLPASAPRQIGLQIAYRR